MKIVYLPEADLDIDRLYTFLIENKASIKTTDKALLRIKEGAEMLIRNPELGLSMNLNSSVNRYNNTQRYEIKDNIFCLVLTTRVNHAMMLIARCFLFFAVLQFVVITSYYASLRLAKKKQQRTLNTIQLMILG